MHRTTVLLDEELYRAVKRHAVDRARPMRALVEEALRRYLGLVEDQRGRQTPAFGIYRSRVKGPMTRQRIYRDL